MRNEKFVILCVDDDEDVLDTLRIILESNGYQVVSASTAEEGLKRFQSESPDMVMVDLMMEEVDSGTNLVLKLKALGNQAPVYMLSSVGGEMAGSIDHEKLGLAGVFQKPINAKVLLRTVGRWAKQG